MEQKFCHACGSQIAKSSPLCAKCGASQPDTAARLKTSRSWLKGAVVATAATFVIGLVAAIVVPAYQSSIDRARQGSGQAKTTSMDRDVPSGDFIVTPARLSSDDLARLIETRMPTGMPLNAWPAQGFPYSERTRIFMWSDNFGTVYKVNVDQLGIRTATGQLHRIPRFALKYGLDQRENDHVVMFVSLNGAGNAVRVSFDGSNEYIELMPNSGDFITLSPSDRRLKGLKSAKSMTVLHGVGQSGEHLGFTYDLEEFREAVAIALGTLGQK